MRQLRVGVGSESLKIVKAKHHRSDLTRAQTDAVLSWALWYYKHHLTDEEATCIVEMQTKKVWHRLRHVFQQFSVNCTRIEHIIRRVEELAYEGDANARME